MILLILSVSWHQIFHFSSWGLSAWQRRYGDLGRTGQSVDRQWDEGRIVLSCNSEYWESGNCFAACCNCSLKDQYLIWHLYKWINSVVVVEGCIVAVSKYWNMWDTKARDRDSAWSDVICDRDSAWGDVILLLSCNIKVSELPRLAIHVASVQILLPKVRKLKYR